MEKNIINEEELKIVNGNEKITKDGSVMRMIAYLSKKLDVDSPYIYQVFYSSLFPNTSKVLMYKDEAIAYVAAIETYYKGFLRKKKLIFLKQWAVLDDYSYKNCVTDKGNSVMSILLNKLYEDTKADSYIVTIAPENSPSKNLARRFANSINKKMNQVGYLNCEDTIYKNSKNNEKEKCYIISKNPKKDYKLIKKHGLLLNITKK
jgi:hypothetical protein